MWGASSVPWEGGRMVEMHLQGVRSGEVMESKGSQACHVVEHDILGTP